MKRSFCDMCKSNSDVKLAFATIVSEPIVANLTGETFVARLSMVLVDPHTHPDNVDRYGYERAKVELCKQCTRDIFTKLRLEII